MVAWCLKIDEFPVLSYIVFDVGKIIGTTKNLIQLFYRLNKTLSE